LDSENIQNDINFIELKKKISKLKNMMLLTNIKSDSGKKSSNSLNNIHTIKGKSEHNTEVINLIECKSCAKRVT